MTSAFMPTAGRLAGAIAFAAFGWYFATALVPYFENGHAPSYWITMGVCIGVLVGWVVVGKRTGYGYASGIGNGFTGVFAFLFWMIFNVCVVDMLKKSLRRLYDGPMEALTDVFQLMLEFVVEFAQPEVGLIVFLGAVATGLFAEFFALRFP
jgi:hypothetical protein